jgi:predicted nucleic acid-binding protein
MNRPVVIDSNVPVAIIDNQDKRHSTGGAILSAMEATEVSPIYFDCVFNETINVFCRRSEEQRRLEQLPLLMEKLLREAPKETVTWISAEIQRLYDDIIQLIRRHNGALNFHDALIALSCQELGLRFIVSFDRDFDQIPWLARIDAAEDVHHYLPAEAPGNGRS